MRQTSLDAYDELRGSELLALRQKMVFGAVLAGPANDKVLAERAGLPINAVTPRRGELVKKGLVVSAGVFPCPRTGRASTFWRAAR